MTDWEIYYVPHQFTGQPVPCRRPVRREVKRMDDQCDRSCPWYDDPYGICIQQLRESLDHGLAHQGGMSDGEHANLVAIEEFIRARDNA